MAIRLPVLRTDRPFRYTVELGGTRYTLRWRPNERTSSWYVDILDASGTVLYQGRRVSPKSDLLADVEIDGQPAGALLSKGPDAYTLEDIGKAVVLKFIPDAELPAAPSSDYIVTV